MDKKILGIGVGEGVSVAKAFVVKDPVFNYSEKSSLTKEEEKKAFGETIEKVTQQVQNLIEISSKNISPEKGEIFKAHLEIVNDEQIQSEINEFIGEGKSQAWAIASVFDKYAEVFDGMESSYFRERASDVRDIKKRFLANACGLSLPDLLLINEECIIIAHDLSPSETAILNKQYVKGFATNIGGATSHSAIMARTLEIPAVVSLKNVTEKVNNGDYVALDAKEGLFEYGIDEEGIALWENKRKKAEEVKKELEKYKTMPSVTLDGFSFSIKGNIGKPKDLKKVIEYGGEGIGLFRSEFLYMESQDWPTEDEQYEAYKEVLEGMKDHEVTIRTLDIGGDKHLNYFTFPKEMNPFLGYRALRLSLDKKEIFHTQLRALLRASVFGKLKIMFPMVTTFEEFVEAKKITEEIEAQLISEGHRVSSDYKIGMMVEIPSAAILSRVFAKESDFFSVGSNDLIQYTHAVDRMSEEVNYLYQPNNPSILNLIDMASRGAKAWNREISVCGEMASNPISAIILIGLGVESLSMSATSIPHIRRVLGQLTMSECRMLAQESLGMSTESEVVDKVKEYLNSKSISF